MGQVPMVDSAVAEYTLRPLRVSPSDLMLDPNNPRLKINSFERVTLSPSQIASSGTQRQVLEAICGDQHRIAPLQASIQAHGFIELDAILVKKLPGLNKYLVLEGNRRTAAVKDMLRDSQKLSVGVRKSLEKIPVKELLTRANVDEYELIDRILAIRHISGPKDWEPMQKAYAIYARYEQQFGKQHPRTQLQAVKKVLEEVALTLSQDAPKVREQVLIFSLFKALKAAKYDIGSDHYSLLQLMVGKPGMANEYFGVHRDTFSISPEGMERFNSLCIGAECPVRNPRDFRDLFKVWQTGGEKSLYPVLIGERSLERALLDLRRRLEKQEFLDQVSKIRDDISELSISSYRGTKEEIDTVRKIKALVDQRLLPLVMRRLA